MSDEEPPVPEEVLTSAKDRLDDEEISLADNEEILHALSALIIEPSKSARTNVNRSRTPRQRPCRRTNRSIDRARAAEARLGKSTPMQIRAASTISSPSNRVPSYSSERISG